MDHVALLKALLTRMKQSALAEAVGVEQSTVSRWLNKGVKITAEHRDKIVEIAREQGILAESSSAVPSDKNLISELDATGGLGGGGLTAFESTSDGRMTFSKEVVRDHWRMPDWVLGRMGVKAPNVVAFPVQGDSMEPTLRDGDIVFIDIRHRVPSPPGIYALADEFGGLVVKRLEVTSRPSDETVTVMISSDNTRHSSREFTLPEITIVGRYIGRFTV